MPTNETPWTADRVKDELPDITVTFSGKVYDGVVVGRLNKFASVYAGGSIAPVEVAWETIADCLNKGVPIRL